MISHVARRRKYLLGAPVFLMRAKKKTPSERERVVLPATVVPATADSRRIRAFSRDRRCRGFTGTGPGTFFSRLPPPPRLNRVPGEHATHTTWCPANSKKPVKRHVLTVNAFFAGPRAGSTVTGVSDFKETTNRSFSAKLRRNRSRVLPCF